MLAQSGAGVRSAVGDASTASQLPRKEGSKQARKEGRKEGRKAGRAAPTGRSAQGPPRQSATEPAPWVQKSGGAVVERSCSGSQGRNQPESPYIQRFSSRESCDTPTRACLKSCVPSALCGPAGSRALCVLHNPLVPLNKYRLVCTASTQRFNM